MKQKLLIILFFATTICVCQNSFVIQNVRLFDGEKVLKKVSILVEDGKISEVRRREIKHITVINGEGKTLIPALTNAHVHVWSPLSLQEAAKAGVLNLFDMHAMESLMPMMKGFRTSSNHADYYAAGSAATVPEGHGTQYGFPAPTLTKPEEAKAFIEARINAGANYIKIIREPWKATLDKTTITALINESHKKNMKAVVHVSKVKDGYQVLKDKADGLVHIWDDAKLTKNQLKSLKKESFFVIPTLLTLQKIQEAFYKKTQKESLKKIQSLQEEVKRLYDIGVPILAGTDPPNGNINYGVDLYKEMFLLHQAGISTLDVLKSATSLPIVHFNIKNKGFIKKGYRADFVLIDGDPTANIKDIANNKRIFKQGKEVK